MEPIVVQRSTQRSLRFHDGAKTAYERGACLQEAAGLIRERARDLARTTILESGKRMVQAKGEWGDAADLFDWFAERKACRRTLGATPKFGETQSSDQAAAGCRRTDHRLEFPRV